MDTVSNELRKFLLQTEPEVLVLKGKWGVGKTYLWNQILSELRNDQSIVGYRWYCYTSLFGINSLEKLKASIFEGMGPLVTSTTFYRKKFSQFSSWVISKITTKPSWKIGSVKIDLDGVVNFLQKYKSQAKLSVGAVGRLTQFCSKVPLLDKFVGEGWQIGWVAVENAIICIDDLERVADGLQLKDVFGLIAQLKEIKKCKIIIILNENELKNIKDGEKDYATYREKIVDVEINYTPDNEETSKLILQGIQQNHFDLIIKYAESLGIKNLRTFQKIKAYYMKLADRIKAEIVPVQNDIISALVLFVHIAFSRDDRFPSAGDLVNMTTESYLGASMTKYLNEQNKKRGIEDIEKDKKADLIINLNSIYGWVSINEIDRIVGEFVINGWMNDEKFNKICHEITLLHEDENNKKSVSRLKDEIQEDIWHSLDLDFDDLTNKMLEALARTSEFTPCIGLLSHYVTTLRELGGTSYSQKLIDFYFDFNSARSSEYFDLQNQEFRMFGGNVEEDLAKLLNEKYEIVRREELVGSIPIESRPAIFEAMIGKMNQTILTEDDLEVLQTFSPQEFSALIKANIKNKKLDAFVRFFMSPQSGYMISTTYEARWAEIKNNLISAAKLILAEKPKAKFLFGKWNILPYLKDTPPLPSVQS